jgi:hypothetical protein
MAAVDEVCLDDRKLGDHFASERCADVGFLLAMPPLHRACDLMELEFPRLADGTDVGYGSARALSASVGEGFQGCPGLGGVGACVLGVG